MRITGIRLTNYARFRGDHELELGPGVYAIVARDSKNARRSNWLGKSTLLSAIRWALYGALSRQWKTLDDVISHGEKEVAVDLELSDGTFISRTKKRGQSSQLKCCMPDGKGGELTLAQDQAQLKIVERLGIGLTDFDYTVWMGQKSMARIVNSDPSERTKVVVEWLSLGPLERAAVSVNDKLTKTDAQLTAARAKHAAYAQQCAEDRTVLVATEQTARETLDELNAKHETFGVEYQTRLKWEAERDRHAKVTACENRITELETKEPRLPRTEQRTYVSKKMGLLDNRYAAAKTETDRLSKLQGGHFDGTCPIMCGTCPVPTKVLAAKGSIGKAYEATVITRDRVAKYREAVRIRQAKLVDATRVYERWQGVINSMMEELRILKHQCQFQVLPVEPADVEQPPDLQAASEDWARAKAIIELHDRAQTSADSALQECQELENKLRILQTALRILGKGGAQRKIATRALTEIEAIANAMLVHSGVDLTVELDYGRELQDIAAVCGCGKAFPRTATCRVCEHCGAPRGKKRDEKLYINMSDVSGAAEDLAGIAIQLAAARWRRVARGVAWSVVAIDEPFSALDAHHRGALARALSLLATDGFAQAFVVAHNDDILEAIPNRLLITADGKWSKIEVG